MEMPEICTGGLGAGNKRRSGRRGLEKLYGCGVVNSAAVVADQRARSKKVMGETGIGDYVAVGRFRFIFELKNTSFCTVNRKQAPIG